MTFPAQLSNVSYLQKRDFSLVQDKSAGGETPLVTIPVCHWSPSMPPHPWTEAYSRIPKQKCVYVSEPSFAWSLGGHQFLHDKLNDGKVCHHHQTMSYVGSGTDSSIVQRRCCGRCFSQSGNLVSSWSAQEHPWSRKQIRECCWHELQRASVTITLKRWTCLCVHPGLLVWKQPP